MFLGKSSQSELIGPPYQNFCFKSVTLSAFWGPLETRILVEFFYVTEDQKTNLFQVQDLKSVGYFGALSGAPRDPNFYSLFFLL